MSADTVKKKEAFGETLSIISKLHAAVFAVTGLLDDLVQIILNMTEIGRHRIFLFAIAQGHAGTRPKTHNHPLRALTSATGFDSCILPTTITSGHSP